MTITSAATGSSLSSTAWIPSSRAPMREVHAKMPKRKSRRIRFAAICPRDSMQNLRHKTVENFKNDWRRLQDQSRRPHAENSFGAGPYARRHRAARPRKRDAIHRRHVLSRSDLAFSAGNRSRRVRGVGKEAGDADAAVEAGDWRK